MKFYNPAVVQTPLLAGLFVAGVVGMMLWQGTVAVTTPDCGNPNVVERAIHGDYAKPGNSVACPDVANLKNIFHPVPAREGCPADLQAAIAEGMVTSQSYGGTCADLALLVKARRDSGVWPRH